MYKRNKGKMYASYEELKACSSSDRFELALMFFYLLATSYGHSLGKSFGFAKTDNRARSFVNAQERLRYAIERLRFAQIFCRDGLDIVDKYDIENAFVFIDTPYVNTDCGHYEGVFTESDFERLLARLLSAKCKFMMTSFDSHLLAEYAFKGGWYQRKIELVKSMSPNRVKKVEVITTNYPI
jgi:DNA adenine methylase